MNHPKPLEILKKGLNNFSKKIKARKDTLTLKLLRKETISSADEQWLDHEANTVEEERILLDLEQASDYERGFERLNEDGKAIVSLTMNTVDSIIMHKVGTHRSLMHYQIYATPPLSQYCDIL